MNPLTQFMDLSKQSLGIIPILGLILFVVLVVAIERAVFFARMVPSGAALERDLVDADHRDEPALRRITSGYQSTVFGMTLNAIVDARHLGPDEMDRYIDEAIVRTLPQLDRQLWLLDAAVTLGPLIGLLGTIIGITESFSVLSLSGPNVQAVTGGVGHALIATGCGLAVAIVGVAANSYFSKRVRLATLQLDLFKLTSVKRLHLLKHKGDAAPLGRDPKPVVLTSLSHAKSGDQMAGA